MLGFLIIIYKISVWFIYFNAAGWQCCCWSNWYAQYLFPPCNLVFYYYNICLLLIWFVCPVRFNAVASNVSKHISNLCALEQIKTSIANTKVLFLSFLIFKFVNHILVYSNFDFVFCVHFLILWCMHFLIFNICYSCWMWILSLFDWIRKKMRIQLGWRFRMILRLYCNILPF